MRKIIFILSTAIAILLCGCASDAKTANSAAPSALDGISVTGEYGKKPDVKFTAPFKVNETVAKVIKPGSGITLTDKSIVMINYYGVNGRTGKVFDESFTRPGPTVMSLQQVVPGFRKGLSGQKVGSRVVIGIPGKDGYDPSGGSPQAGIEVGDTLIFVVDILDASLDKATGQIQTLPADFPKVEQTKTGFALTPSGKAVPTEASMHYLIKGEGKPINDKLVIGMKWAAYSWKTGKELHNETASISGGPLEKLDPAWQKFLTGVPTGSRIMIVTPASQADKRLKPAADDAVVYVIDILMTIPKQ